MKNNQQKLSGSVLAFFAANLVTLFFAYLLKAPCLTLPWDLSQYSNFCYNDLQPLYGSRHLDRHSIPYLDEIPFEYPPLIALTMWLASFFSTTHQDFFYANLPFLVAASQLTVLGLVFALGPTLAILWYAAGSPVILHAFDNWDLLGLAPLALAMGMWNKQRYFSVGLALGLGTAAKLFPGMALGPVILGVMSSGSQRKQRVQRLIAGAALGWGVFNLPVMIGSVMKTGDLSLWLNMFSFHATRLPDFGTVWHWLVSHQYAVSAEYKAFVDSVSFGLFLLGTGGILLLTWTRTRPVWAMSAALTSLFLVVSKVHSPQYTLWLLPYFVVVRTPVLFITSYFLCDAIIYFGGLSWLAIQGVPGTSQNIFVAGVFLRELVLIALIVWYSVFAHDRMNDLSSRQLDH